MRVHCTNCGRDGHAKWQCTRPTKSTGAIARAASNQRGSQVAQAVEQGDASVIAQDLSCASSTLALPVDTNNPSSRKGGGVESLRTPTEGRKGRDSTSGGARAKLRDPSAVLTQTAAQPPVGTNSSRIENEGVILSASKNAVYDASAGDVGNEDRHTNLARSAHKGENPRHADGGKPLTQTRPAKFNKTAYQRVYMAMYRAEIKSGKRVPKRKGETT